MKCTHIHQVGDKINELINKINNDDPVLKEQIGPVCRWGEIVDCMNLFSEECKQLDSFENWVGNRVGGNYFYSTLREKIEKIERRNIPRINPGELWKYLKEMHEILRECSCYANLTLTENSLVRYQTDYSNLQTQLSGLQTSLQKQIKDKDDTIDWGKRELTKTQNERDDYKNKWVVSEKDLNDLRQLFNNLKLENTNKDNEIEKRNRGIAEKKNEIKRLKGELNLSQEDFLNQKIGLKEEKLGTFIQQLGIDRPCIHNLRGYYEALVNARGNYNQTNIRAAENNIETIKQQFLKAGINVSNTEKTCRKCEKITKLKLELEQIYQQRYEAQQEVPPR